MKSNLEALNLEHNDTILEEIELINKVKNGIFIKL